MTHRQFSTKRKNFLLNDLGLSPLLVLVQTLKERVFVRVSGHQSLLRAVFSHRREADGKTTVPEPRPTQDTGRDRGTRLVEYYGDGPTVEDHG